MKITIEMLKELDACDEGINWFRKHFPNGTTIKNLIEKLDKLSNDHWLGWLMSRRVDVTCACLDADANVHADNDYALKLASEYGRKKVVELLIKADANIHAENNEALRLSAINGHKKVVELLVKAGANVHADNDYALRWASEYGQEKVVELLIKADANIHAENNEALRWSASNGHKKVVELLLEAGANVHACNDYALQYAKKNNHIAIVRLLKKHIKKKKTMKINIEMLKEMNACDEGLVWFLEHFPEGTTIKNLLNKFDDDDWLGWLMSKRVDITQACLNAGADVHADDDYALKWSARNGRFAIVKLLLVNGADMDTVNMNIALQLTKKNNHIAVVKLLKKYIRKDWKY